MQTKEANTQQKWTAEDYVRQAIAEQRNEDYRSWEGWRVSFVDQYGREEYEFVSGGTG